MKMLVLGAGLQGSACAYDLLQNADVTEVRLADIHMSELESFLAPYSGKRLIPTQLDVRDEEAVQALMRESDAVMSALPYYFNYDMAVCAVDAGVHFCDLGGNTEIVFKQKTLHDRAKADDVSVIPDCGLAPGMVNILAEYGIRQLDQVEAVRIFVGGLPQNPEPPLNYQIVYSLEGVLDYYTTLSWVLRGGKRTRVKALSGASRSCSPTRSVRSRRSTRRAACRPWPSVTRDESQRWNTRHCAIRVTRRSWSRSGSSGCSTWTPWT